MKKIILLVLLFPIIGYSQTHIKGNLITKNNEPVAFANIVLQSVETNVKKGTISDEKGFFEFNEITKGDYKITVFYLGYNDYTQNIVIINKNINLDSIILVEDLTALDQVEITVKKPTIVQKAGKLIFTIENTILSDQNSWRILNNTPGVFINQEQLLIKNKAADLYINDKKVQTQDIKSFLEGLGGNAIKSIEVIANPSAKYGAESNSIINLVLKKSFKDRYKGSVNTNYTIGKFDKYTLGTSHFYKKNKIDITANYNFTDTKKLIEETEEINFIDNNTITSKWVSKTDNIKENQNHNLLFNIDYSLNKKSKLSLSTLHDFLVNEVNEIVTRGTIFDTSNTINSTYTAKNIAQKDRKFLSYSIDYTQQLKKAGSSISTTFNYSYLDNERIQNVNTDYFLPDNSFLNNNKFKINTDQKINIYTTQIDYTLPLKGTSKFETGVSVAIIESKSDFKQFDQNLTLDLTKSNLFLYDETNYGVYGIYENELAKFYYQIGVRGEFTDLKGNSKAVLANEINDDNYFKIFPTIVLDYYPNNNHDFVLSYKKSIKRPRYDELNPFLFFFSDFAANVGNPKLKPTITHTVDFTYALKSKYFFNIYYGNNKDKASEITFQDNNTNIISYTNVNLDKYESVGFIFSATNSITKRWSLFTQLFAVNRNYDFIALATNNEIINKSKFSYYINFVNNFTFLKDKSLKASVSYKYISPDNRNGSSETSRYLKTDFSLQKKLFKNRAVLTFGIDDIFDTTNAITRTKYKNQDIRYFINEDTHLFNIGFSYNFGNNKLRANNKKKTTKEEKRLE